MIIDNARREPEPPVDLLAGSSLFLDFDGTLVDIAPRPDAVRVTRDLVGLLDRLSRNLEGRVAILSGRPSSEIAELIGGLSLTIAGHHGLEVRHNDGSLEAMERPTVLDQALVELGAVERRHPGVLIETKPLGLALHYRQAPQAEEECRQAVEDVASRTGLEVQPGKMVFEIRPAGSDKGDALRKLMTMEPFTDVRPLFLGDDLTDEPAFKAAQALDGAGIIIGERQPTAARYRLETVDDAIAWLGKAADRLA